MPLSNAQKQKAYRMRRKADVEKYAAYLEARKPSHREWTRRKRAQLKKDQPKKWSKLLAARRLQAKQKHRADPRHALLHWARKRARDKNIICTLTLADIVVPKRCPALGIVLKIGDGKLHAASPTLDRRNPKKGYTPNNIAVISHRANAIKTDATIKEILAVAAWLQTVTPSPRKVFNR